MTGIDVARRRHGTERGGAGVAGSGGPALALALRSLYEGRGDGRAVVAAFRETLVTVVLDASDLRAVENDGIVWITAFSGEAELRTFLAARGEDRGGIVDHRTVRGRRLLDELAPQAGPFTGIALDLGSKHPMLFPPAPGAAPAPISLPTEGTL